MTTLIRPSVVDLRGGTVPRVGRAGEGVDDAGAVREVYDAHYGRLAGWANRLVGDPDLAHDFATEAFVRLVRSWGTVDEPRAWLYTTTANLVRDHWRKRGREHTAYQKLGTPGSAREPALDLATVLTVREAVLALPDRLRVVVMLHYFADLPVAQVATQVGRSEGTIKRDLFDARRRLGMLLEDAR